MRRGELIHLIWDHVSLIEKDEKIIIDSYSDNGDILWTPKNEPSKRRIPLSDTAINIVKKYKNKHDKYVFPSGKGERLHPNTLENAFNRALDKTDIDFGSIHTLRHTFASQLVQKGADPFTELRIYLAMAV